MILLYSPVSCEIRSERIGIKVGTTWEFLFIIFRVPMRFGLIFARKKLRVPRETGRDQPV